MASEVCSRFLLWKTRKRAIYPGIFLYSNTLQTSTAVSAPFIHTQSCLKVILISLQPPLKTPTIEPPGINVTVTCRKATFSLKKLLHSASKSASFDVVARRVETDDSSALCCSFPRAQLRLAHVNSNTADAKINKHSLMSGKIQIQWQSAKSNEEEAAPHVSICRLQQTLLMSFFFPSSSSTE